MITTWTDTDDIDPGEVSAPYWAIRLSGERHPQMRSCAVMLKRWDRWGLVHPTLAFGISGLTETPQNYESKDRVEIATSREISKAD
ncbi:hypothetical protein NL676_039397 [Syzygium grande]|nr:hypothetical protein NL676_039397 [Syzygium grande]